MARGLVMPMVLQKTRRSPWRWFLHQVLWAPGMLDAQRTAWRQGMPTSQRRLRHRHCHHSGNGIRHRYGHCCSPSIRKHSYGHHSENDVGLMHGFQAKGRWWHGTVSVSNGNLSLCIAKWHREAIFYKGASSSSQAFLSFTVKLSVTAQNPHSQTGLVTPINCCPSGLWASRWMQLPLFCPLFWVVRHWNKVLRAVVVAASLCSSGEEKQHS